jgi:hypothetical protein
MARDPGRSKTYVLEVLKKSPEAEKSSSRWVPHTLNDDQKSARVEMAASMLSILELSPAHTRSCELPRDEFWFYFSYDSEGKGALARDPSITKPKA